MNGKKQRRKKRSDLAAKAKPGQNPPGDEEKKQNICRMQQDILQVHEALFKPPEVVVGIKSQKKKRTIVISASPGQKKTAPGNFRIVEDPQDDSLVVKGVDAGEKCRIVDGANGGKKKKDKVWGLKIHS